MYEHEQKVFNFNVRNKKGFGEIIYGKGIFSSVMFASITLIFIAGLILIPWKRNLVEMIFKGLILIAIIYNITVYFKSVIKVSFNDTYLYIRIWRKHKAYPLESIERIKLIYYPSWGFVKMRITGPNINKSYHLWAPTEDKERYDLYLRMKDYIEEKGWCRPKAS